MLTRIRSVHLHSFPDVAIPHHADSSGSTMIQLTTGLQHDYLDDKTSFPDASCELHSPSNHSS